VIRTFGLLLLFASSPLIAQTTPPFAENELVEAEIERPVPPEALALGHHGVVVLTGDILPEGRASNMTIAKSSGSSILDDLAVTTFAHSKISGDLVTPSSKKIRLKVEYGSYDFDHMGLGYLCKQAVIDADWRAKTFPEAPIGDTKFANYVQGLGLIEPRMAFAQNPERFAKAWQSALVTCRTHPDAPFLGAITIAGKE
jgi:TonB family protein